MAQVSSRILTKEIRERIQDIFMVSLSSLTSKDKVVLFLEDYLTDTEKIMLSKRLSIAFMLLKGYKYETISDVLKVSKSTIWNVKRNLLKGKGYKIVLTGLIKKENFQKFWQDIDHLLNQILPPRINTDWKEVRRKQWEARRKQTKPF